MIETIDTKIEPVMNIPKSLFIHTLKDAITTKDDNRINDLGDLLYSQYELHTVTISHIQENARRIDLQHQAIQNSIDITREGFKNMEKRFEAVDKRFEAVDKRFEAVDKRFEAVDKRFEAMDKRFNDLIHHMDKRFEAVDKRFEAMDHRFNDMSHHMDRRFSLLTWMIGIGFVAVNSVILLVKFLG